MSAVSNVRTDDGWTLSVERIEARGTGAPAAVAVVSHAMMVDRRTLHGRRDAGGGLIAELAQSGIAVCAADLRGHGQSGPLAAAGGRWSYDDLVDHDTPALVEFARASYPGVPVYAVGHSLFGHVALAHLSRRPDSPLAGLVMLAGNIWLRRYEASPARWLQKRMLLETTSLTARALGHVPIRRLGLGTTDEARAYFDQFRTWARRDDWTALDGYSYRNALGRVRARVLSVAGAGDELLCRPECAERYTEDLPDARCLVAGKSPPPGARSGHLALPFDPGHMDLVLDGRCRPVWRAAADFILGSSAAPPK